MCLKKNKKAQIFKNTFKCKFLYVHNEPTQRFELKFNFSNKYL